MGDEEEVTEQQRFQQSVERRLNEEMQARSAMEEQLKSIHIRYWGSLWMEITRQALLV